MWTFPDRYIYLAHHPLNTNMTVWDIVPRTMSQTVRKTVQNLQDYPPIPAAARYCARGQPSPPQPTTSTEVWDKCSWPVDNQHVLFCVESFHKPPVTEYLRHVFILTSHTQLRQEQLSAVPHDVLAVEGGSGFQRREWRHFVIQLLYRVMALGEEITQVWTGDHHWPLCLNNKSIYMSLPTWGATWTKFFTGRDLSCVLN